MNDRSPYYHPSRDLAFSAWLGVFALIPRLYVAVAWPREPVWDGHYYDFGAKRIAAGFGYSDDIVIGGTKVWHPWCHYPVGYSGLLGGIYKIFGSGPHVATIANAVIGALIVVLIHRISRHMLSRWRARAAAVICAIHPGLIVYSALVMTELASALGPLVALWWVLRDSERHWIRAALMGGVFMGLSVLVHPQALLVAPVLGWACCRGQLSLTHFKRAAFAGAIIMAATFATVLPWTIRNCRVMDGCALVSTNGGWNLAIGSLDRATGRFETIRASDGCEIVTGQVQQDRCWAGIGVKAIKAHPMHWLALAPVKLWHSFHHDSFAIEYLHQSTPSAWPDERREWWRDKLTAAHRLLLSLAAFGFAGRPSKKWRSTWAEAVVLLAIAAITVWVWQSDATPFHWLALSVIAVGSLPRPSRPLVGAVGLFIIWSIVAFVITHVMFFGEDRYHVPIEPLFCILAAAALRASASKERAENDVAADVQAHRSDRVVAES